MDRNFDRRLGEDHLALRRGFVDGLSSIGFFTQNVPGFAVRRTGVFDAWKAVGGALRNALREEGLQIERRTKEQ